MPTISLSRSSSSFSLFLLLLSFLFLLFFLFLIRLLPFPPPSSSFSSSFFFLFLLLLLPFPTPSFFTSFLFLLLLPFPPSSFSSFFLFLLLLLPSFSSSSSSSFSSSVQEAKVLVRIDELRRVGMWSAKRMPKAGEPAREKSHHDYMLEEMQWLANDFKAEAKWKRANAKKIARAVEKYHQVGTVVPLCTA